MKIVELRSSNIKRIKAVELQLDEKQNVVMITGKNAAGKSSVLDSIWFALGGAKAIPDKPIRDGEEKAEVQLDLGEYTVTRTFTENGTYLKVENKDGARFNNPQELLNNIIGKLSFDPLEFAKMEPKDQIKNLSQVVGVDFSDLEEKKKQISQDRLLAGRELKALGSVSDDELKKAQEIAAKAPVSVTDLSAQLERALADQNKFDAATKELADLKEETERINQRLDAIKVRFETLKEISKPDVDIVALRTKIATAEQENAAITEAKKIVEHAGNIVTKNNEYGMFDTQLKQLDEQRTSRLSEAKMPIAGMSWSEEAVLYKGIPFAQLSSAEQLKVSMAIAMVANPTLRVILIRDGSLLDNDNLKVIQDMASNLDFQVWIERVDDTGKVGIFIEDGEVKTVN